jgi:hypothetical protein
VGLYNFQARFIEPILSKHKRQTIRAARKRPDQPGDTMHLYVGLRRPGARLLGRHPCVWSGDIVIHPTGWIRVDDELISPLDCEILARHDGFKDYDEMFAFWAGRLPFEGRIIGWDPDVDVPWRPAPRTHPARDLKLEADRRD